MAFPDICVEDRQACPNERVTLFFYEQTCGEQTVQLRDSQLGCPIDLTDKIACLLFNDILGRHQFETTKELDILDATEGIVKVSLLEDDLLHQGLFLGEFQVLCPELEGSSSAEEEMCESSSGFPCQSPAVEAAKVLHRLPCFVEVSGNIMDMSKALLPITIGEVRMAIRDKCSLDNFLLDDVQFSNTEIAWAIRRPVEWWNETPPPINTYSPATFPFRYNHLNGIVGELLLMVASMNEERNRLTYSAAGLTVGDRDSGKAFTQAGQMLIQDFRRWALGKKKSINMGNAFQRTEIRSYGNVFQNRNGRGGV